MRKDYVDVPIHELTPVLAVALGSESPAIVERATRLIHFLGEHGFESVGELLR